MLAWSAWAALIAWWLITVVAALAAASFGAPFFTSLVAAGVLGSLTHIAFDLLSEDFPMAAAVCVCGCVTAVALCGCSATLMHTLFGQRSEAVVVEAQCPPEQGRCVYRVVVAGSDDGQEPGWLYRWPHGQLEQGQRIEVSAVPGQWIQPVEHDRKLSGFEQGALGVAGLAQAAGLLVAVGAVVGRRSRLVDQTEQWIEG